jgi:hypothetical protein
VRGTEVAEAVLTAFPQPGHLLRAGDKPVIGWFCGRVQAGAVQGGIGLDTQGGYYHNGNVQLRREEIALLNHDGVFEMGIRKGFASALLSELLDVETVRAAPENHTVAWADDFHNEILHAAVRAGHNALCNNFDQLHR